MNPIPNPIPIPCPKCRRPGVLYSERAIAALIGSKHIAHVLHTPTDTCRYACRLTRSEFERIGIAWTDTGNPRCITTDRS